MIDGKLSFNEMRIGAGYYTVLLLGSIMQKTARNGNPYVEFSLSDGKENIIARKFNSTNSEMKVLGIEPNSLVRLTLNVGEYNGAKNYTVSTIAPASGTEYTIDDFIVAAPIEPELGFEELIKIIQESSEESIRDFEYTPLSYLAEKLLVANKDAFCKSSAAKMVHHNVVGGLLYHSLTMARNAKKVVETYPNLDKELLICGTALHDIGKIHEMNTTLTGAAEYTSDGRLLGHAMIGIMMIEDERRKDPNYDTERVKLLQHMLASHHGQLEFGAITTPAIPEATVLHALDMIDSRMYMFNEAYKDMEDGMLSGNIYGLENSSVYKAPPAFYYEESNEYWDEQVDIQNTERSIEEYKAKCENDAATYEDDECWYNDSEKEYEW